MGIVEERLKAREAAIRRVAEWVRELNFPLTAVLIGSYARGDFNVWSDVDVLIVSDSFPARPLDRLKMVDPPEGVEVIPLTTADFHRLRRKKNLLVTEAEKYGIVLRDDLGLFAAR
jgi:predicted nucleotidyltransferase